MSSASIRNALEETAKLLTEHPAKARTTSPAVTAILEEGLVCRINGPSGELRTDMPPAMGGRASAPSPGWLMRAALASCTATVIGMRAAQLGISLDLLEVTVSADSDARGMLGLDGAVSAAMTSLRTQVAIGAKNVPGEQLIELVRWAEAHAPVTRTVCSGDVGPAEIEVR